MLDHPYTPFLAKLQTPGRYLGGEFGSVNPPPEADLRIVLSYPDTYEIGMSHIGLAILYELTNALEGISAERVFMPWPDLEVELLKRNLPLVSLEAARPLNEFDILGFSLQYELTYTNLLAMLKLGGVPLRSVNRGTDDPLVLVGGPIAAHCEPLAPFVDICLIGDGEEALPEMIGTVVDAKKSGLSREETLDRVNELPFVYLPGRVTRTLDPLSKRLIPVSESKPLASRAIVKHLGAHPTGRGPVPTVEAVFDRYSVEVARGCASGCRFCQAGFMYRPVRERNAKETKAAVEQAVSCLGFDDVSLASLSTADHSQLEPIVTMLGDEFTTRRVSFSVPSLRAYGLPDKVVEVLSRLRATGVTLAPEAGSQRLRDAINKNVTEEDLLRAAARFFDRGLSRIKLYFMIGLPGETDDDLREIVELATRLRDLGRKRLRGRTPTINISASTFIPKPFTPFEREAMIGAQEVMRRQQLLKGIARTRKIGVKLHLTPLSILEGILCRGDASLADLLERATELGARFDGWDEMYNSEIWSQLLEEVDIEAQLEAIPDGACLPWDGIETGIDGDFLVAERERSRQGTVTPPCGRTRESEEEKDKFTCHKCGLGCRKEGLPVRIALPTNASTDLPMPVQPKGKPRPRVVDQPDVSRHKRVRLYITKWGRQAFVGHLDTMRHVMRSLRRAGLEVVYTQGFHPKPKIVSCPPLPLGVAALSDPLDVFLVDPPGTAEILNLLGESTPADLKFVAAEIIPTEDKTLGKRLHAAEYLAFVSAEPGLVQQGIDKLLASKTVEVERTRKGRTKTVDIRPFIIEAKVLKTAPDGLPFSVGAKRIAIGFTLAIPGSGGARPQEVLEAVCSAPAQDSILVRSRIILS
jgi:radical SAM family uncharacterized protein/radical SAM-linked protein